MGLCTITSLPARSLVGALLVPVPPAGALRRVLVVAWPMLPEIGLDLPESGARTSAAPTAAISVAKFALRGLVIPSVSTAPDPGRLHVDQRADARKPALVVSLLFGPGAQRHGSPPGSRPGPCGYPVLAGLVPWSEWSAGRCRLHVVRYWSAGQPAFR